MDTDREVALRFSLAHLIEDALDHGRRKLFRGESIASTNNTRESLPCVFAPPFIDGSGHIQVKWFAEAPWLFGTVNRGAEFDAKGHLSPAMSFPQCTPHADFCPP